MLDSGTKVRVKSREEINKTLTKDSDCNGVFFKDAMYAFCGQTLTLTAYFSNEAYSAKESFYNWRPEWFDVIETYDDLQADIWSGTLEDQMLNLAMLHQVESGKDLNVSILEESIAGYDCFPNKSQGGFNYGDYSSEKWKPGRRWCESPPDYKWLNLKPKIVEKIIKEAVRQKSVNKLNQYPEDPDVWFSWIISEDGINFWSNFHKKYQSNIKQTLTQNERNQIKLQRKKASIRVGTVPEGCRVHGKRCKASVRSRHLSYTARIGY